MFRVSRRGGEKEESSIPERERSVRETESPRAFEKQKKKEKTKTRKKWW